MIIILACVFVLISYKWADWKNWKSYYSTMLFFIAGDFIQAYVSAIKPLWRFSKTIFPGMVSHLVQSLIIFPCTVLLFFTFYPRQSRLAKTLYISFWVLLYAVMEYIEVKLGLFFYANGWRFAYSVLFNIIIFPLLAIHQRKPQLAWLLSFIIGGFLVLWFKLPASH